MNVHVNPSHEMTEQMRQHRAHMERRARLWGTSRPNVKVVAREPVELIAANDQAAPIPDADRRPPPWKGEAVAMWQKAFIDFNQHVIDFRLEQLHEAQTKNDEVRAARPKYARPSIMDIVMEVLVDFPGVTVAELKGKSRVRSIVRPRQLAMYEVYTKRRDLSLPHIGRWFGDRDHTTVLHSVEKIRKEKGKRKLVRKGTHERSLNTREREACHE